MGPSTGAQGCPQAAQGRAQGQLSERRIAQPQLSERVRRGEFRLKARDMGPPFSAAYAPTFCR
jgi:hypothetical protein